MRYLLLAVLIVGCTVAKEEDDDAAASATSGAGGSAGQANGGSGGDGGSGPNVPPGCERSSAHSNCLGTPGIMQLTIEVAGDTRYYRVYAPNQGSCMNPSGILFFFHGLGGNEQNFNALDPLAESENLLFVQPRGSPQSWANGAWGWVPDGFDNNMELVRAIRTSLEQGYEVDPYRVYIAGFSQGAFMSAALASPNAMGNEVAGVGIFGGGEEGNTCPSSSCYATLACKVPFFMRTGDTDQHLQYTQALYDGLLLAGWPAMQLDFQTFPGGHTIRQQDLTDMIGWLDEAYPTLP